MITHTHILNTALLVQSLLNASRLDISKPEIERDNFYVSKQHLELYKLTFPEFQMSIKKLDEQGYTGTVLFVDDKFKEDAMKGITKEQIAEAKKALKEAGLEMPKITLDKDSEIFKHFEEKLPKNKQLPADIEDEVLDFANILDEVPDMWNGMTMDTIAQIEYLGMRDIDRLVEKLSANTPFEDIIDTGIWYDEKHYQLYIDGHPFSTKYGAKLMRHYALQKLFRQKDKKLKIYFTTLPVHTEDSNLSNVEQEQASNKAYYKSLHSFQEKISEALPNYKDLFLIDHNSIQFNPDFLNQI